MMMVCVIRLGGLIFFFFSAGYVFRCRGCKAKRSLRHKTFFEDSHLPLHTIFELIDYWTKEEDSLKKLKHELELGSDHRIIDWKNSCRDICAIYYFNNPQNVGDNFPPKYSQSLLQHL